MEVLFDFTVITLMVSLTRRKQFKISLLWLCGPKLMPICLTGLIRDQSPRKSCWGTLFLRGRSQVFLTGLFFNKSYQGTLLLRGRSPVLKNLYLLSVREEVATNFSVSKGVCEFYFNKKGKVSKLSLRMCAWTLIILFLSIGKHILYRCRVFRWIIFRINFENVDLLRKKSKSFCFIQIYSYLWIFWNISLI